MQKRAATRGAVLNVVIKSGTNNFHGSAYYFNRNEALASSDWFTPPGSPTTKLRNNQEGFSLGGPIVKNNTFFFVNYEQQNYEQALSAPGTTPSAAWVSAGKAVMAGDGVAVNPLMQICRSANSAVPLEPVLRNDAASVMNDNVPVALPTPCRAARGPADTERIGACPNRR
ncbi:MAG: hypothetical protein ABSH32_11530 [Bryobacteraceae bacterium]